LGPAKAKTNWKKKNKNLGNRQWAGTTLNPRDKHEEAKSPQLDGLHKASPKQGSCWVKKKVKNAPSQTSKKGRHFKKKKKPLQKKNVAQNRTRGAPERCQTQQRLQRMRLRGG